VHNVVIECEYSIAISIYMTIKSHLLNGSLGSSGNIVRKGTRRFNLQYSHNTNRESKESRHCHGRPKDATDQLRIDCCHNGIGFKKEHQRNKEQNGIHIVVKCQFPMIVINDGQDFFRKDGIERDKETAENSSDRTLDGKVDFSLCANTKADNDNTKTKHGTKGSRDTQENTREEDVEYNGERSCHIVEGDFDEFQTEIVKGNHANKH